jgi:DNA-binding transcriptional ArsR family regulator
VKGLSNGASRHRILVILADRREVVRGADLQEAMGFKSKASVSFHVDPLIADGLVEKTPAGYRLCKDVVVGREGFVGRLTDWVA